MSLRRSAVSDIDATIASHFLPISAGIMSAQLVRTISQVSPISLQSALAMSISNPTSVPSGLTSENGG